MTDQEMLDVSEDETNASNSDGSSDAEPIESLIAGRQRRETAGNRYNKELIAAESEDVEDEDEVNLLFAEDEAGGDDEDFRSDEADDEDMSSSDDDDQGPQAGAEDLEGEKELKKKEKAERATKRKRDLALTTTSGLKKRARIDPTLPAKPVAKPSKRKERVSWLPTHDTGKARTSLRKQTVAHRELTIKRLEVSEAQRLKYKAVKERRDRQRAAEAPKELTQADRLAEAAKIERRNAKSLSRWEESERKRAEEQAAKLAALRERKLEGAVVSFLSRKGNWIGPKQDQGVSGDGRGVKLKPGPKPKGLRESISAVGSPSSQAVAAAPQSHVVHQDTLGDARQDIAPAGVESQVQTTLSQPRDSEPLLHGIHEYASLRLQSGPESENSTNIGTMSSLPPLTAPEAEATRNDAVPQPLQSDNYRKPELSQQRSQLPEQSELHDNVMDTTSEVTSLVQQNLVPSSMQGGLDMETPASPPVALVVEYGMRNLVGFKDMDELDGQHKQDFSFLNNRRTTTYVKKSSLAQRELCLITNLPARYRDPTTGIAYANKAAFDKIRELKQHQYSWSGMLGCYVGREGVVARGVPEGFLGT